MVEGGYFLPFLACPGGAAPPWPGGVAGALAPAGPGGVAVVVVVVVVALVVGVVVDVDVLLELLEVLLKGGVVLEVLVLCGVELGGVVDECVTGGAECVECEELDLVLPEPLELLLPSA